MKLLPPLTLFDFFKCFLIYIFLFFFNATISLAQETPLVLSNKCIKGFSPFTKVNGIDCRQPSQNLGVVLKGWLNQNSKVEFEGNFMDSLCNFFLNKDIASAPANAEGENEITILLYDFHLSEIALEDKSKGMFTLMMRVFNKLKEEKFEEFFSIDTVFKITTVTDVTKKLLESVNDQLCKIATDLKERKNLLSSDKPQYSYEELLVLDSLEKLKIPIYSADNVNPGVYYTYEQFKNNTPDTATVVIDTVSYGFIIVSIWNEKKSNRVFLDYKSVFAVCDGNILLKGTPIGYYKMKKVGLDFYFYGATSIKYSSENTKVKPTMNNGQTVGAPRGVPGVGPVGGVGIGAGIGISITRDLVRNNFKIAYLNGNSVSTDKEK